MSESKPHPEPPASIKRMIGSYDARIKELEEQLEATRSALQALVDYADGKVGDDFGTTEWARAREVLNPASVSEPGAANPVPGVSTDDVGCVPGSETPDPASSRHDNAEWGTPVDLSGKPFKPFKPGEESKP